MICMKYLMRFVMAYGLLMAASCQEQGGASSGLSGLTIATDEDTQGNYEPEEQENKASQVESKDVRSYQNVESSTLHQVREVVKMSGRVSTATLNKPENQFQIICFKKINRKGLSDSEKKDYSQISKGQLDSYGYFEVYILPDVDTRCGLHDLDGKQLLKALYVNSRSISKTAKTKGTELLRFQRSVKFNKTKIIKPSYLILYR
jgi:hypothetical protein